jgi:hypothetical protein
MRVRRVVMVQDSLTGEEFWPHRRIVMVQESLTRDEFWPHDEPLFQTFRNLEMEHPVDRPRGTDSWCPVFLQSEKSTLSLTFDFDIRAFLGRVEVGDFYCIHCRFVSGILKDLTFIPIDDFVGFSPKSEQTFLVDLYSEYLSPMFLTTYEHYFR